MEIFKKICTSFYHEKSKCLLVFKLVKKIDMATEFKFLIILQNLNEKLGHILNIHNKQSIGINVQHILIQFNSEIQLKQAENR